MCGGRCESYLYFGAALLGCSCNLTLAVSRGRLMICGRGRMGQKGKAESQVVVFTGAPMTLKMHDLT